MHLLLEIEWTHCNRASSAKRRFLLQHYRADGAFWWGPASSLLFCYLKKEKLCEAVVRDINLHARSRLLDDTVEGMVWETPMRQVLHFDGDERSCTERIRRFLIELKSLEDRVTPYLILAASEHTVTKLKLDLEGLAPPYGR